MGLLITDIFTTLGSLILAFYYSWKLTLAILATVPVALGIVSFIGSKIEPAIQKQKSELDAASKICAASLKAVDQVKVCNAYGNDLKRYSLSIRNAGRYYLHQAARNALQMGWINFWVVALFALGFWYGLVLVEQGLLPGSILTAFYAVLSALQGLEALFPQWMVFSKGMSAGINLSMLGQDAQEQRPVGQSLSMFMPECCMGDIEFRNVSTLSMEYSDSLTVFKISFSYPTAPKSPFINQLSCIFPAGQTTFIVGRSGSGKSTIGQLIAGVYETSSGTILYNGQAYRSLHVEWLRQNITLVEQSSYIFDGSIAENISMGLIGPKQLTGIDTQTFDPTEFHDLLAHLSGSLNDVRGSGSTFSGGEKQRIALARARVRDPKVLILDEAVSAMDRTSREIAMATVRKWRRNKTTIIITHDLTPIENDDFVYVMDNGQLVQQGFKEDLMSESNGVFNELSQLQFDDIYQPSLGIIPPTPVSPSTIDDLPNRASVHDLGIHPLDSISRASQRSFRRSQSIRHSGYTPALNVPAVSPPPYRRVPTPDSAYQRELGFEYEKMQNNPSGTDIELTAVGSSAILFGTSLVPNQTTTARASAWITNTEEPPTLVLNKTSGADNLTTGSIIQTLASVWPALEARYRIWLVLGASCCVFSALTTPAFAFSLAQLLASMWAPSNQVNTGRKWALYLIAIAVGDGIFTSSGRYFCEMAAQAWANKVRLSAMEKVLHQDMNWFSGKRNSVNRLVETFDRNAEEMRNIVGRFVPIIITFTTMISASFIWALASNWQLSLVALAPLPLVVAAVKGYAYLGERWEAKCTAGAQVASSIMAEVFEHIKTVRIFTSEMHFEQKHRKAVEQAYNLGLRRGLWSCLPFGLYQSFSFDLLALAFYYGTRLLTHNNSISADKMLQVMNLLLFGIGTAIDLLASLPQITMAQVTAAQILQYTDMVPDSASEKGTPLWTMSALPIRMNDLKFSYKRRPGQLHLRGVSLTIHPRQCIALVSPSGGGKSTILSLLLGLQIPLKSTIPSLFYAGVESSRIDIYRIRELVGYVSQTPFLFPDTVATNIAYGLSTVSLDDVKQAAQEAGIHSFIQSLPQGYRTVLGDGGQALSGGQAQRINIARALVRRPQLLILDEPTSALDAESAALVSSTLQNTMQARGNMAIVMVTHSIDMMRAADSIIVIADGTNVGEGTYKSLQQTCSEFRHLIHNANVF